MFIDDQRQFYKELDGKMNRQTPDPKRSPASFGLKQWSTILRGSEWSKKVKVKVTPKVRVTPKEENVIIKVKELKRAIARMSNWKASGPDHVQGF